MTTRFRHPGLLLCALLLLSPCSHATTRLVLGLDELISTSELVFLGSVAGVRMVEENGLVYSLVRFTVEEVLEGDTALAELELRFVGGTTAAAHTDVAGQFIPAVGAEGLWFVDDTVRDLVNPLTGWSQGYFPIVTKADGTRWLDLENHPDYGILAPAAPLADKMRAFNFPEQQIEAEFPRVLEYPLDDFVAVLRARAQGD